MSSPPPPPLPVHTSRQPVSLNFLSYFLPFLRNVMTSCVASKVFFDILFLNSVRNALKRLKMINTFCLARLIQSIEGIDITNQLKALSTSMNDVRPHNYTLVHYCFCK